MASDRLSKHVKRYTTMSSALQTLTEKKIVLLSPSKWDDSNDIYFMDLYRNHVNAESVLALCCTMATETYHHWRVFTAGIEGVCIEFKLEPLAKTVAAIENVKSGPVNYRKIDELKAMSTSDLESLPFIKRLGYKDEKEWRIVAKSNHDTKEFIDIPIELTWINRIILNPWMPPPLVVNIRGIIKSLPDCSNLSVVTTGLTNSKLWKEAGKAITAPKN